MIPLFAMPAVILAKQESREVKLCFSAATRLRNEKKSHQKCSNGFSVCIMAGRRLCQSGYRAVALWLMTHHVNLRTFLSAAPVTVPLFKCQRADGPAAPHGDNTNGS